MLPVYELDRADGQRAYEQRLTLLRESSTLEGKWYPVAAEAIADVRQRGDQAIVASMQQFVDPGFDAAMMRVGDKTLRDAAAALDPALRDAITRAIENVRAYQQHILPAATQPMQLAGATLGMRWSPIAPVGLYVPGGSAVLFSTLIMLAVPAMVAGVQPSQMTVVTPMPNRSAGQAPRDVAGVTLAVCHMLGIEKVFRIGGATAVAALALGTQQIEPVNFIAGPGHPVVQAAKLQLMGKVGIDGYYGASEIVTLADETACPQRVAGDLLAQAEHDPGKCFLVTWSRQVADHIVAALGDQLGLRRRAEAIVRSLEQESCAVVARDRAQALGVVNALAGEHVNLAVADPQATLAAIDCGGEFFLGDSTAVACGDYYAGPSHCLPTGTTARFSSGVSVYTFLKRSGVVHYRDGLSAQAIEDIARMAEAEGLDGHAASVRLRG